MRHIDSNCITTSFVSHLKINQKNSNYMSRQQPP